MVLRGDAGRLVFSGEFTPLNIFAISLGSRVVAREMREDEKEEEEGKETGARELKMEE